MPQPPRGPECSPDNIGWDIPWGPEKVPPARCHMMGGTGGPRACSLRPRAAPALFPYHMCFAWSKFRCWSSLCRRSLTMYLPSMLSRRPYLGKRRVRTPLFTVARRPNPKSHLHPIYPFCPGCALCSLQPTYGGSMRVGSRIWRPPHTPLTIRIWLFISLCPTLSRCATLNAGCESHPLSGT